MLWLMHLMPHTEQLTGEGERSGECVCVCVSVCIYVGVLYCRSCEGIADLVAIAADSLTGDGHLYYLGSGLFGILGCVCVCVVACMLYCVC